MAYPTNQSTVSISFTCPKNKDDRGEWRWDGPENGIVGLKRDEPNSRFVSSWPWDMVQVGDDGVYTYYQRREYAPVQTFTPTETGQAEGKPNPE